MQDNSNRFDADLSDLDWSRWLEALSDIIDEDGYVETLGDKHVAAFLEEKQTLLVTFDTHKRVRAQSEIAHPLGWTMVRALGWSHLALVSNGDTWFRNERVYAYFDRLVDDGFFDEFDQVIFYGAGPCGYAAAAFSVVAPGAKVLVLQPQATLDPRLTEWDDRFLRMRRTAFDDRYGYAPDMLEAAAQAFVLYDPEVELDAMHAALFYRPHIERIRTRFLGPRLDEALIRMQLLPRLLAQLSADKLTPLSLARLLRERHKDPEYQTNLLRRLTIDDRSLLTSILCRKVLQQRDEPKFLTALTRAEKGLSHRPRGDAGPLHH
ncbi:hypothetical protein PEL8287_02733 [Roseovarius litorisediminis]|uniref:Phosphoadenosine phosphosulfate reductase n=1 Tax=Roseovarius litorisediminis TaxID=1312363 RepID=A0A1Y5T1V8_9RHOB|nr:phosphoadenosine phosphosulfate reductase [Roseovarius litorisediminis]SLN52150.1 hypothetical protein PEL8287_02733 [Roseovarius litorisediminis]